MIFYHSSSPIIKALLIGMTINIEACVIPILAISTFAIPAISGGFTTFRRLSSSLFKNYLNLEIRGNQLPQKPTIFVVNYPNSYVEYLVHGLFGPNLCLIAFSGAAPILRHVYGNDHIIGVGKNEFDKLHQTVKRKLKNGYNILAYVERDYYNRKHPYDVTELRTGMFHIAQQLGSTITPICVDHVLHSYGLIKQKPFKIMIGETKSVTDVNIAMNETRNFFLYWLNQWRNKAVKMKLL